MSAIDQPDPAEFYDATLRFQVQSERDPHAKYMVELDSYDGNGRCSCEDFTLRREPLVSRRVTAEEAVNQGLVKVPKSGRVADALRCKHIILARDELASAVIRSLAKAEKAKR